MVSRVETSCCVFRAADWKLDAPDWSGRMRITAKGKVAYIKLEDKVSGTSSFTSFKFVVLRGIESFVVLSGELFAQAPVKEYPGVAVETVSDSSRYFVLRIQDESGEGTAC